jgi:hypothetical protein
MNADEILFRCSSLGYIMVEPRSKSELLSETCKTHLVDVYVSNMYNRFTEINAKQLDKGNEVEEDSITVVSRLTGTIYNKNEKHLSNKFIKGTLDLFEGESIEEAEVIRDTKSSWDAYSFFRAKNKGLDPKYFWQGTGYMALSKAKKCYIDYCLNNTPFHLVESELRKESYNHPENNTPAWIELQIIANHVYDKKTFDEYMNRRGCFPQDSNAMAIVAGFVEIPLTERHFNFEIKRDNDKIESIYERVTDCREFMNEYLFKCYPEPTE